MFRGPSIVYINSGPEYLRFDSTERYLHLPPLLLHSCFHLTSVATSPPRPCTLTDELLARSFLTRERKAMAQCCPLSTTSTGARL